MSASDHKRWSEDLAAYMLDALEPPEAVEMERHLEGCERCQGEMRWLTAAVRTLPESVEALEPPRRLRESLLAEARADARSARPGSEGRRSFLPAWLRGGAARPQRMRFAAGFAALALAIAGAAGYELGQDGPGSGGPARTVVTRQVDGIAVKMIQEGDRGTLELANVHQLPPDRVLQGWVLRRGKVEAVPALLVPDRKGHAETTIADMRGVEEVMVTEEPRGGSDTPTSKPILAMAVPQ
jgi:anti-sigma factor RsiW